MSASEFHMRNCAEATPTNRASKIKSTEWRAAMEGRDNGNTGCELRPLVAERQQKGLPQKRRKIVKAEVMGSSRQTAEQARPGQTDWQAGRQAVESVNQAD